MTSFDLKFSGPIYTAYTTCGPGELTLYHSQKGDTRINADDSLRTEFTLKFYMPKNYSIKTQDKSTNV